MTWLRGASLMVRNRLRTDLLFTYNGASMDSGVKTSERETLLWTLPFGCKSRVSGS